MCREREKADASQAEAERLGQAAAEAQADLEACHTKEAELLLFTQQLTSRSVQLQSDHSLLSLKVTGEAALGEAALKTASLACCLRPPRVRAFEKRDPSLHSPAERAQGPSLQLVRGRPMRVYQ